MIRFRWFILPSILLATSFGPGLGLGQEKNSAKEPSSAPKVDAKKDAPKDLSKKVEKADAKKVEPSDANKMPLTKLDPAKLVPNLCLFKYRVSTASPECQAFVDQALCYYYSYVWMEAARSFETATQKDPNCAFAWWGLSKSIEKWGKGQQAKALDKAKELLPFANPREAYLIKARLQEKGAIDNIAQENRKKEAIKTLDELLALFEDDEEAWMCRGLIDAGSNSAVPFFKALLRINPLHPGAHHELVHHYENIRRPALGWPHAEGYIQSSPGIAHAFHMQAHLATRIGKWTKTTDWSTKAIVLEEAYHRSMNVKPTEDWQFSHHLETLMTSVTHDGRFRQARELKAKCEGYKFNHYVPWLKLHVFERNWESALAIIPKYAKNDKTKWAYYRALVFLAQGDIPRATAEVQALEEIHRQKRNDKDLDLKLWETKGYLMALTGNADGGLKLMGKTVLKTKDSYSHHSWGQGAYHMEQWGLAALRANRLDVAEEAFLEALAHDAGSVRGALGMKIVCERQGRTEEAIQFHDLAERCWKRADSGAIPALYDYMRGTPSSATTANANASVSTMSQE